MSKGKTIDYLEEDVISPPNQVFALVSFVAPHLRQKSSDRVLMKIRGVFSSKQEADNHAKRLMQLDTTFDIYMMEVGKWVVVPPNANEVEEQTYNEEFMNKLMKGYHESQVEARKHFDERKRMVQQHGLDAALTEEEKIPAPQLDEAVHPAEQAAVASGSSV